MSRLPLHTVLQRIVGAALASSAGVVTYACSGSLDTGAPADSGAPAAPADTIFAHESEFTCPMSVSDALAAVKPAQPVDYLELRTVLHTTGDDGGPVAVWTADATYGTPCATATDGACVTQLAAFDALPYPRGWPRGCQPYARTPHQILLYTRGNTAGSVESYEAMREFLGTIGSVAEVRLLVDAAGRRFECLPGGKKLGVRVVADGSFEVLEGGTNDEIGHIVRTRVRIGTDGTWTQLEQERFPDGGLAASFYSCYGRRPDGLVALSPAENSSATLALHFANMAHLEAASVVAFRRLESELRALGAPASLIARARRSRRDEIRHARETAGLARRFGGVVPPVEVELEVDRDRFAIALENAVEGCVRETYGALASAFQAKRAAPELRPTLHRIAVDEARHAELAHDVAAWLEPQLSADERARIADAKAGAAADLRRGLAIEPGVEVRRVAGMPSAREARLLLDGLVRAA
ncbi:MAG: ferritin-like domain-containing protein [Labilithrix sp.]|nr:ferritin-like domain-containing protein [Labilithrix sp.]MCW5815098.1 ferritin-like domain-containing protein [Labilithrix sp.]